MISILCQGSFQRLLNKQGGKRAAWEYPFAVAGVNITFMIMQMLDLHSCKTFDFFFPLQTLIVFLQFREADLLYFWLVVTRQRSA